MGKAAPMLLHFCRCGSTIVPVPGELTLVWKRLSTPMKLFGKGLGGDNVSVRIPFIDSATSQIAP
jgi:hypothetical protein